MDRSDDSVGTCERRGKGDEESVDVSAIILSPAINVHRAVGARF